MEIKVFLRLMTCKTTLALGLIFYRAVTAEASPSNLHRDQALTPTQAAIWEHVNEMSLEDLLGQKLLVGLPWKSASGGDEQLRTLLRKYKIGNFFVSDQVYKDWRSFESGEHFTGLPTADEVKNHIDGVRALMRDHAISIAPVVATDYEGGRVQHLRDVSIGPSQTPSPMAFAAATRGDPEKVRLFGALVGKRLRHLGITTNFAPLADLANETVAPIIGTRSYSSERSVVQVMATKFAQGLVEGGVVPVLKHWPGLGGIYPNEDSNEDLDVHDFTEPMRLKWRISRYRYLYRRLLAVDPFRSYGAVMSAHVATDEHYDEPCPFQEETVVTTCRQLVLREFRTELDQHARVLISDDLAYLRALDNQMESEDDLSDLLFRIFESDHDIVIIGSTVPRMSYEDCGDPRARNFGCNEDFLESALESLYRRYGSIAPPSIRASVVRVLEWKYKMYQLGRPSLSIVDFLNGDVDRSAREIAVGRELEDLATEVFTGAISLVAAPTFIDLASGALKERVGLSASSRILCVGPTYSSNDLEKALEGVLGADQVDCVDLNYNAAARRNPQFASTKTAEVAAYVDRARDRGAPYDVLIFGMADLPSHQEVAENVAWLLGDGAARRQAAEEVVWVAFDSPTVLSRRFVGKGDYALATFSNSRTSNEMLVKVLFGVVTPNGQEMVPVEVDDLIRHVEPMEIGGPSRRGGYQWLLDIVVSDWKILLYRFLGAAMATVTLWCVTLGFGDRKMWRRISVLAGCSGFALSWVSTVFLVDGFGEDLYRVLRVRVVLGAAALDFLASLVLTFIVFGLLGPPARWASLKLGARRGPGGKRDSA